MSLRHPLRYAFRLITGASMIALLGPAFAQHEPEEDGTTRYSAMPDDKPVFAVADGENAAQPL